MEQQNINEKRSASLVLDYHRVVEAFVVQKMFGTSTTFLKLKSSTFKIFLQEK